MAIVIGRRLPMPRRALTIAAVALMHLIAIWALLRAFDVHVAPDQIRSIVTYDVAATQIAAPDPEPSPTAAPAEPEGASAAPAPLAQPRPVSAPPAVIPRPKMESLPPVASEGDASRAGAAREGAGTGGNGGGIGTGSGVSGSGMGGNAIARRAEKIAGEIRARDYPRASVDERDGASVTVRFTIAVDGRPRDCRIHASSGNTAVDRITCELVMERFRYRPAADAEGNPVEEIVGWRQRWWR